MTYTRTPVPWIRRLVVAGDITAQYHLSNPVLNPHFNPDPKQATTLEIERNLGGAGLLVRLIRGFLGYEDKNDNDPPQGATSEYHLWKVVVNDKKESLKAYDRFLGYSYAEDTYPGGEIERFSPEQSSDSPEAAADAAAPHTTTGPTSKPGPHTIVVLDDCNVQFRQTSEVWPAEIKHRSNEALLVILKTTHPFDEGTNMLLSHCVQSFPHKLMIVLSDDDLRKMDIQLTKNLAWETAIDDLLEALQGNFRLDHLRRCRWIVLPIGISGIIVVQNPEDRQRPRVLHVIGPAYLSTRAWDAVDSPELARIHCSWLTAAVAATLATCPDAFQKVEDKLSLDLGRSGMNDFLRQALWQIRKWSEQDAVDDRHLVGLRSLFLLDPPKNPWNEYRDFAAKGTNVLGVKRIFQIEHTLDSASPELTPINVDYLDQHGVLQKVCQGHLRKWTFVPQDRNSVENLARLIAQMGPEYALDDYPFEQFSRKLVTADREEIVRFRTIRRLLREYERFKHPKRPLCLAVFGGPGTGKSFVVKEIAKAVFGESTKFLTFNLSQFSRAIDLIGALHQVRDSVLKNENPVVFWDEFDCPLERSELGWLRYFLAPMQDGEFQEDQITHAIGKAVFVFAGGIYHKWDDFQEKTLDREDPTFLAETPDIRMSPQRWKESKAPDFKSRLQAHLDILSPNGEHARTDRGKSAVLGLSHYLRRALLLRHSLREREPALFHGDRLEIEYGVLDALLFNKDYKFGARSIEAILTMSELGGKRRFTRSDLPPDSQLAMHVTDLADFKSLLLASQ